jgi:plastocyanin
VRLKHAVGVVLSGVLALALPGMAFAGAPARPLVIGVDHVDRANQQPALNRLFEYTDFFSRQVQVQTGATIDFRYAPGSFHIVALATSEKVARSVYPIAFTDADGGFDTAIGSGRPKIVLGPSNFSITGGSTNGGGTIGTNPNGPACGVAAFGQAPCTFRGADDIEVIGPVAGFGPNGLTQVDQLVNITAAPGKFAFFCYIHPGMRGTLTVVGAGASTTSQKAIDAGGLAQFRADRASALAVESQLNHLAVWGGKPGQRTFLVYIGASAANNHVAIDEMLPNRTLNLDKGDRVLYVWRDPHNVHSVYFPTGSSSLPGPFGFDCGTSYNPFPFNGPPTVCLEPNDTNPEVIADPGTAPAGTLLTSPTALVGSGVLIGTGYGVNPTSQTWSTRTNAGTSTGTYMFQCSVHDFMHGWLNVQP